MRGSRVLDHVRQEVLPVRVVRYVGCRRRPEVVALVRDGELLDQVLAGLDLVDAQQLRGSGLQVGASTHAPADHRAVDDVQLQRIQTHGADHATLEACVVRSEVDVVTIVDEHLTEPLVVLRPLHEVEHHDVLLLPVLLPDQGTGQGLEGADVQVVVQAHGRQRLGPPGLEVHADRVLAAQLEVCCLVHQSSLRISASSTTRGYSICIVTGQSGLPLSPRLCGYAGQNWHALSPGFSTVLLASTCCSAV